MLLPLGRQVGIMFESGWVYRGLKHFFSYYMGKICYPMLYQFSATWSMMKAIPSVIKAMKTTLMWCGIVSRFKAYGFGLWILGIRGSSLGWIYKVGFNGLNEQFGQR